MKKITQLSFFLALVFSLFGAKADAQVVYEPAPFWGNKVSRTVGQITKVMSYDFGGNTTYTRRVIVNPAPFGIPNYGDYATIAYEGPLTGSGIDTVALSLAQSPNLGWRAWVTVFNSNFDEVASVLLFNQVQPLNPLQISFPDPQYGYSGSLAARNITYFPTINSIFNPPDQENYTNIFNVRLACDGPSGYDVTRTQGYSGFSSAQSFSANFNLPLDISGTWCLDAWVSVTHNSLTPKFWDGEKVQWSYYPPCFEWVDITTSVDPVEEAGDGFVLYPNPFNEVLAIKSPVETDYQVVNLAGQIVHSGRLMVGGTVILMSPDLPSGMYILQTELGATKLIKQ